MSVFQASLSISVGEILWVELLKTVSSKKKKRKKKRLVFYVSLSISVGLNVHRFAFKIVYILLRNFLNRI